MTASRAEHAPAAPSYTEQSSPIVDVFKPVAPLVATGNPEVDELFANRQRLWNATYGLRSAAPDLSVHGGVTRGQRRALLAAMVISIVALVLAPRPAGIVLIGGATLLYLAVIAMRLTLIILSTKSHSPSTRSLAYSIPDGDLPIVSVLVPAYREPEVVPHLVEALGALDYPPDKLEILLVLEEDDDVTIAAARGALPNTRVQIVAVPPGEPRTKPKALNYALQVAKGSVITVYDAEDRPDPLQLRLAIVALERGGRDLACVQAQLNYFNPGQNLITRWFTLEYTMWFTQFLPGLVRLRAPVPLGGTSNHFRRDALIAVGGWDPYNVTEDADLGLRFFRMGFRVGVIDSVTLEEANSDFVNWVKQRSRWYKGYLQTWLVNMRNPACAWRDLGPVGFGMLNLFVGGTPLLALMNPLFWLASLVWFTLTPDYIRAVYPAGIFYPSMMCWLVGNFLYLYAFVLTGLKHDRGDKRESLVKAAYMIPGYYVMMSLAAYKAFVQLIFNPSYWEKTQHGLQAATPVGEQKLNAA